MREVPSTPAQDAGSPAEHHNEETRVLTCHQRVIVRVGEAGEIWGHVIHLHPHADNVLKARQSLQLLVIDVVKAKAVEQEHQQLAVGSSDGEEGEEGEDHGEDPAAPHGRQRRWDWGQE